MKYVKVKFSKVGLGLVSFGFPPTCVGCGACLPPDIQDTPVFCPKCQKGWERARVAWRMVSGEDGAILGPISLVRYTSAYTADIPEKTIYHIKHRDERRVFDYMARELLPLIKKRVGALTQGVVVTYPPRRTASKRQAGFDQAQRLAHYMAKRMGGRMLPCFQHTGQTYTPQKKLNAHEREENAKRSYRFLDNKTAGVKDRVVVLIDDVYTTGATMHACAKSLLGAGAKQVVMVTVGQTW